MTRARFATPPTVADYGRMTQRARLAAAEALAERLDAINHARTQGRPPLRTPNDWTPEETWMTAHALHPIITALHADPPHIIDARRAELRAADIAWNAHRRAGA